MHRTLGNQADPLGAGVGRSNRPAPTNRIKKLGLPVNAELLFLEETNSYRIVYIRLMEFPSFAPVPRKTKPF
jgi:hypothetical protein